MPTVPLPVAPGVCHARPERRAGGWLVTAAAQIASGPCPTYWDWQQTGVNERGCPCGGNVLKCAHCRHLLHEHAASCPWPAFVAAPSAGQEAGEGES